MTVPLCFTDPRPASLPLSLSLVHPSAMKPHRVLHQWRQAALGAASPLLGMRFDASQGVTSSSRPVGARPLPKLMQKVDLPPEYVPYPLPVHDPASGFGPIETRSPAADVVLAEQRLHRATATAFLEQFGSIDEDAQSRLSQGGRGGDDLFATAASDHSHHAGFHASGVASLTALPTEITSSTPLPHMDAEGYRVIEGPDGIIQRLASIRSPRSLIDQLIASFTPRHDNDVTDAVNGFAIENSEVPFLGSVFVRTLALTDICATLPRWSDADVAALLDAIRSVHPAGTPMLTPSHGFRPGERRSTFETVLLQEWQRLLQRLVSLFPFCGNELSLWRDGDWRMDCADQDALRAELRRANVEQHPGKPASSVASEHREFEVVDDPAREHLQLSDGGDEALGNAPVAPLTEITRRSRSPRLFVDVVHFFAHVQALDRHGALELSRLYSQSSAFLHGHRRKPIVAENQFILSEQFSEWFADGLLFYGASLFRPAEDDVAENCLALAQATLPTEHLVDAICALVANYSAQRNDVVPHFVLRPLLEEFASRVKKALLSPSSSPRLTVPAWVDVCRVVLACTTARHVGGQSVDGADDDKDAASYLLRLVLDRSTIPTASMDYVNPYLFFIFTAHPLATRAHAARWLDTMVAFRRQATAELGPLVPVFSLELISSVLRYLTTWPAVGEALSLVTATTTTTTSPREEALQYATDLNLTLEMASQIPTLMSSFRPLAMPSTATATPGDSKSVVGADEPPSQHMAMTHFQTWPSRPTSAQPRLDGREGDAEETAVDDSRQPCSNDEISGPEAVEAFATRVGTLRAALGVGSAAATTTKEYNDVVDLYRCRNLYILHYSCTANACANLKQLFTDKDVLSGVAAVVVPITVLAEWQRLSSPPSHTGASAVSALYASMALSLVSTEMAEKRVVLATATDILDANQGRYADDDVIPWVFARYFLQVLPRAVPVIVTGRQGSGETVSRPEILLQGSLNRLMCDAEEEYSGVNDFTRGSVVGHIGERHSHFTGTLKRMIRTKTGATRHEMPSSQFHFYTGRYDQKRAFGPAGSIFEKNWQSVAHAVLPGHVRNSPGHSFRGLGVFAPTYPRHT